MQLLDIISNYWQIITAGVVVIMGWSKLNTTNKDQERRIVSLESRDPILLQIQKDIVEIKTTLHFVEQKIDTKSQQ